MHYPAHLVRAGKRTLITFPGAEGAATFAEAGESVPEVARGAIEKWIETRLADGDLPVRPDAQPRKAGSNVLDVRVDPLLAVRLQLRWARQDAGVSQGQLARLVGVSRQQISLLESSEANPTLRTLEKVATALGLAVDVTLVERESMRT